jgi:hypothetical protein
MKISDHVLKLYNRQCQLSIIFGEISRHPFNRASRRQLLSKVGASDCCLTPTQQICSTISWQEQVNFQWDDEEVRFVLDQHAEFDFYSARSLKQQPAVRRVVPLRQIILIPSQPVFVLSP